MDETFKISSKVASARHRAGDIAEMPLLNGTCWYPINQHPCEIPAKESKLFRVRQTGEVFDSYEDYTKRLRLLQSKNWTSQISGKNGLNYEEAIHEDTSIDALVAKVCDWARIDRHGTADSDHFARYSQKQLRLLNNVGEWVPSQKFSELSLGITVLPQIRPPAEKVHQLCSSL